MPAENPPPELQPYVEPTGHVLENSPPFTFRGMTARVFPLRANIDSLQTFVDSYLNFVPAEVGRFRAVAPYVQLMMLDYGKMSQKATNTGWLSQREIVFSVPLAWYKAEHGRWVFHDFASVAPFLYVDDVLSMGMGRTVFGWPKTLASLSPTIAAWMSDPLATVNQATVSTNVFAALYHGRKLEQHVFLEVDRSSPLATLNVPVDVESLFAPWAIASNLARAATGFGADWLGLLRGLGVVPTNKGTSADNYSAMLAKLGQTTFPLRPDLGGNTLNLKQFRSSKDPSKYVYQALTNGPMRMTALNRMGVLGEDCVLLGDLSGGYAIRLHEWPSQPIVQTLGLHASRRWDGPETPVAELKPVLPYWFDVNMEYLTGSNLAYRSGGDCDWYEPSTKRTFRTAKDAQGMPVPEEAAFNTTLGSVMDAVAGPFMFTETTIRVLPLMARAEALTDFIDDYLNKAVESHPDPRPHFRLWCAEDQPHAYVYLTLADIGGVVSMTNNIGDWADHELMFLVPVQLDYGDHLGVGLVPAFTYVDGAIAAVARSEVLGLPTTTATFEPPPTTWITTQESLSETRQDLLYMNVEVLPAVGEGQKTQTRRILSLVQGPPGDSSCGGAWAPFYGDWAGALKDELARKKDLEARATDQVQDLLALALEPLGNSQPFSLYTVKQFRDVANPELACYQSVVRIPRQFLRVFDLREVEQPLVLRMHEFPSQPIVQTLGLLGVDVNDEGTGTARELQPVRPFSLRVTMREGRGAWIAGSKWAGEVHHDVDDRVNIYEGLAGPDVGGEAAFYFDRQDNIKVSRELVAEVDEGDSRQIAEATHAFVSAGHPALDLDAAKEAIRAVDPQVAVEIILSREWGNWDPNARWHQGRAALVESHRQALQGVPPRGLAEAEKTFFEEQLGHPGPVLRTRGSGRERHVREMIERVECLTRLIVEMDEKWHSIVERGIWQTSAPPSVGARSLTPAKIEEAIHDFLDSITALGEISVKPASLVAGIGPSITANAAKYKALAKSPLVRKLSRQGATTQEFLAAAWEAQGSILQMADLLRHRRDMQRDGLFDVLSAVADKPNFVVRRDSAGRQADEFLPLDESFDETWFEGPPVTGKPLPAPVASRRSRP